MDKEWLFEGKCSRHKGWWREGKHELATHSSDTDTLTDTLTDTDTDSDKDTLIDKDDHGSLDQYKRSNLRGHSHSLTASPRRGLFVGLAVFCR